MFKPQSYHTYYAFEAIKEFLNSGKVLVIDPAEIPEELLTLRACFVSVFMNDELRGCIGSYELFTDCLLNEIIKNAIHAASNDKRFFAISLQELDDLVIKVEVVGNFKPVLSMEEAIQIDTNEYGVKVEDLQGNVGVVLPKTSGITSAKQAINLALQKGNITEINPTNLSLYKFRAKEFL